MKDEVRANSRNENTKLDADGLADLPVAEAKADETKGGPERLPAPRPLPSVTDMVIDPFNSDR